MRILTESVEHFAVKRKLKCVIGLCRLPALPVRPLGISLVGMSTRVWYGGLLCYLLLFVLYGARGACDLCTFMNQTTGVSSCSASCGGGQQYYYRYVCCLNLTRSDCESRCNLTLTLTKSIQHFIGCGQECYGGGTFNETTESCLCPQGTTGPCCDLSKDILQLSLTFLYY